MNGYTHRVEQKKESGPGNKRKKNIYMSIL